MSERISFHDTSKGFIDGMMKSEAYLKRSTVDHKLLELIKYRVSQINGCAYCLDMHHKEATHLGESELRLHSLAAWRECPFYDGKERAALAFAEAMTQTQPYVLSDEVFDSLAAFYSKAEVADITLTVTQINAWNRLNRAFRPVPGNYNVGQFAS